MKGLKHSAAVSALLLATTSAGAQEKITFSDLSWNGAQAIGHVLATIVEQEMGGDAEIVSGMNQAAVIMAGMDKGDGSIDVFTDMWMPNQQALWDEYIEGNGTVNRALSSWKELTAPRPVERTGIPATGV